MTRATAAGSSLLEQIAAIVTQVHSDTCINCSGFLPNGNVSGFSSLSHKSGYTNPSEATHWDWPERTPSLFEEPKTAA